MGGEYGEKTRGEDGGGEGGGEGGEEGGGLHAEIDKWRESVRWNREVARWEKGLRRGLVESLVMAVRCARR